MAITRIRPRLTLPLLPLAPAALAVLAVGALVLGAPARHAVALPGEAGGADTVFVRIDTELGAIVAQLYPDQAPLTVTNFLRYVDADAYRNARFHRTVRADNQPNDSIRIAVVQIGRDPTTQDDPAFPPIPLERTSTTGLRHVDGALSMARTGPDTGTWHFSIVVGDQPEMDFAGRRQPDGQGFAVFGRVVEGMDVVHRVHRSPADGQSLSPPIHIQRIVRVSRDAGH
jgi:peptidyl-prolyl cis-trans isomerase A (cyclophilin A)